MALWVVTGPPAAGKTTWVQARARPGDIVVDYDRLAQALTAPGAPPYEHGRVLRSVAHKARLAAIAEALRQCAQVDVYVIHTQPRPEALAKYQRHGARMVTIDPGREVVLARCQTQRSAQARAAAERWYDTHSDIDRSEMITSRSW